MKCISFELIKNNEEISFITKDIMGVDPQYIKYRDFANKTYGLPIRHMDYQPCVFIDENGRHALVVTKKTKDIELITEEMKEMLMEYVS